MPQKGYDNLTIPTSILEALEEIVQEPGSLYVSVSELAKEALREKVIAIRSQNKEWMTTKRGGRTR